MVAGAWMLLAAVSAFVAIRIKMPAALVEIIVGMLAGNLIALRTNAWIDFVAGFGSILLTFLAGAEIDPVVLRRQLVPSTVLGGASFGAPFLAAMAFAYLFGHWSVDASKIAGIAMSTTSVAVVYAVMIESGLAGKEFGQIILAACFFTDLGTVVALGMLFANYNLWLVALIASIVAAMVLVPKLLPGLIDRTRRYVSEPALRVLFAIIFLLAAVATYAKSEGVLPAYFLGLACAGMMITYPDVKRRLQTMTMTLLAPFYFLKAGTYIEFGAALANAALIATLFFVKVIAQDRRSISPRTLCLQVSELECELPNADDGDGLDFRHDFEPLRTDAPLHRPGAVYRAGNRRYFDRSRSYGDRASSLQAARRTRRDGV